MLKKYTKYVATAFAVASLSTFMIGCGDAEGDGGGDTGTPTGENGGSLTNNEPAPTAPTGGEGGEGGEGGGK